MRKPDFYKRLDPHGRKVYNVYAAMKPFSERFIKLMNQKRRSKDASGQMFYNQEERDFLGKENLVLLGELHPADAELYMMED
jgi:hypothetical protein